MKILHTSDWHLGKMLYSRTRHEEHARFLDHLCTVLQEEQVRVLVVAGDVFDTLSPSCRSQQLYYGFLARLAALPQLDDVVIVAGNHDSPAFLSAPEKLLDHFRIHVITAPGTGRELLTLRGRRNTPYLIVAAVPYLREADVRTSAFGESAGERAAGYRQGVCDHYRQLAAQAREAARQGGARLPVIATGHLFAAGGRPLQAERGAAPAAVGTLEAVPAEALAAGFAYTALGHLHGAQAVGGLDHVRYCGSPLPLSFAELGRGKKLVLVELDEDGGPDPAAAGVRIRELPVPCFQELAALCGDADAITADLGALIASGREVWAEVCCTADAPPGDLAERIRDMADGTCVSVLAIRVRTQAAPVLEHSGGPEALARLDPDEVFRGFLEDRGVPQPEREGYAATFNELRAALAAQAERKAEGD